MDVDLRRPKRWSLEDKVIVGEEGMEFRGREDSTIDFSLQLLDLHVREARKNAEERGKCTWM